MEKQHQRGLLLRIAIWPTSVSCGRNKVMPLGISVLLRLFALKQRSKVTTKELPSGQPTLKKCPLGLSEVSQ